MKRISFFLILTISLFANADENQKMTDQKLQLSVGGNYNVHLSGLTNAFVTTNTTSYFYSTPTTTSQTYNKGGLGLSADLFVNLGLPGLAVGAELAYLSVYEYSQPTYSSYLPLWGTNQGQYIYTNTASLGTAFSNSTPKISLATIPMLLEMKYFAIPNFYLVGGVGISFDTINVTNTAATGIETTTKLKGDSHLALTAGAGYALKVNDNFSIDPKVKFYAISGSNADPMLIFMSPTISAQFYF